MSSSLLPVQRSHKLGKYFGPILGACVLATGCSLFQHQEQSPAQKLLDEPITHPRHVQAEAEAKPSWFQTWFGPPAPPKPQTMGDWVGQPKPSM
jgi:hypothetical protein